MTALTPLVLIHVIAAGLVLVVGGAQILRPRRDAAHRWIGRSWIVVMIVVCTTSFFIHPHGFSWLHALAVWTLFAISMGFWRIRSGDVRGHRAWMIGTWLGTVIAFAFAVLTPARLLPRLLGSDPVALLAGAGGVVALSAAICATIIGTTRAPRRRGT